MARESARVSAKASASEIGRVFDEVLAEIQERERAGERVEPTEDVAPEVAEAGAALKAIFGGEHHLTADLSFDQVYAKALPHFVTILKHVLREKDGA